MSDNAQAESRQEFLAGRRFFLGSSEAAAACGLNPWSTPLHVYLSKVGELPDYDSAPKAWGRRLEDVVAQAYSEETGRRVLVPEKRTVLHPQLPWMGASLDRLTVVDGQEQRILEIKTSSQPDEWGDSGTDEIPDAYNVQVQHQLAVTGLAAAEVAVLINAHDFRFFHVPRSDRIIGKIIGIEADLWERIQQRRPPAPDFQHPATLDLLRSMYGVEDTLRLDLGDDALELAKLYTSAQAECKLSMARKDKIKAQLLAQMGQAGMARLPNGWSLVRKLVHRQGYPVEPTSYVTFRIHYPREGFKHVESTERHCAG